MWHPSKPDRILPDVGRRRNQQHGRHRVAVPLRSLLAGPRPVGFRRCGRQSTIQKWPLLFTSDVMLNLLLAPKDNKHIASQLGVECKLLIHYSSRRLGQPRWSAPARRAVVQPVKSAVGAILYRRAMATRGSESDQPLVASCSQLSCK